MAGTPILWGRGSSSNVQKVLWACGELGLNPDHRQVGGSFGGNDAPWFLALNPNGTVPVWQQGSFALFESHAILRHLARSHGALYGTNKREQALTDQWLDWYALVFWPPVRKLFLQVWRDRQIPLDAPEASTARAEAARGVAIAAERLQSSPFLAGPEFGLADISLCIGLHRLLGMNYGIPVSPQLAQWLEAQRRRPAFAIATRDDPIRPDGRSAPGD